MVKASVAFGPIIHGEDVDDAVNTQFASSPEYKKSLLLGLPMIQAYVGERNAPPFGVFIHESARSFYPTGKEPFMFKWWKWFLLGKPGWNKEKTDKLKKSIEGYFAVCLANSISLDYLPERIESHRSAAEEYFLDK